MKKYQTLLEKIRDYFPAPTSDKMHDAYFVSTIMHALDQLDEMKGTAPVLGKHENIDYSKSSKEKIPENLSRVEDTVSRIVEYACGLEIWGHPNTQTNVIPPATIPSIVGKLISSTCNANIIWDEYSHRFALAEVEASGMLCDLIGYELDKSCGVFTFGGTGTNLYGVYAGIMKAIPDAKKKGIREDVRVFTSECGHYSLMNVVSWLGIGIDNLISIETSRDNDMRIDRLEEELEETISSGVKVGCVVATMGTTDAFGIDDLKEIIKVRDKMVGEFDLDYVPHVHADAVIGWVWSVFNDYDFSNNPLEFSKRTLRSINDSREKIKYLHLADSTGVDFHKTGYGPYISSAFLVKNRSDLEPLYRKQDDMPYLYQFGEYHPGMFTLECSRAADGPMAALANLRLLGREGYRVIIGHVVEMAEILRERFESFNFIHVLNDYNLGPVTLFRVYPEGIDDATMFYSKEVSDPGFSEILKKHNKYNRAIFEFTHNEAMLGRGVTLSLTECYRKTTYSEPEEIPILAIKSFIMSPFTDENAIQTVADKVLEAREHTQME